MEISANVVQLIKEIQQTRKEYANANLRIAIDGDKITHESLNIGFDSRPPDADDKVFTQGGVTVLVDSKTAVLLDSAVFDFADGHFTLKYLEKTESNA